MSLRGAAVVLGLGLFAASSASAQADGPDPAPTAEWWRAYEDLPGGVHILPVDSFYVFEADQEREIHLNMQAFGPSVNDGRYFAAHTVKWEFDYTWKRPEPGMCQPTDLRILARSVITMPQVQNVEDLEPELRARWDRFYTALRIHELGHRNILEEFLVEFRELLLDQPPRPCDLDGRFQLIYDGELARLQSLQDAYDERTESGRTQGAVWPLPRRR